MMSSRRDGRWAGRLGRSRRFDGVAHLVGAFAAPDRFDAGFGRAGRLLRCGGLSQGVTGELSERCRDRIGTSVSPAGVPTVERIEPSNPPRRPAHRPSRRNAVIDGAMGLFATMPVDEVTVQDVASAVEMTPAAVYYHFASKEQILLEGMEHFRDQLLAEVRSAMPAPGDTDGVRQLVVHVLAWAGRHRTPATVYFVNSIGLNLLVEALRRETRLELVALLRDAVGRRSRQARTRRGRRHRRRAGVADRDLARVDAQPGRHPSQPRQPTLRAGDRPPRRPHRRHRRSRPDAPAFRRSSWCRGGRGPCRRCRRGACRGTRRPRGRCRRSRSGGPRSRPSATTRRRCCSNSGRMSSWSRTMKPRIVTRRSTASIRWLMSCALAVGRVLADHAAQRDAAADVHVLQRGHQVRPADVVEVHVEAVGSDPRHALAGCSAR